MKKILLASAVVAFFCTNIFAEEGPAQKKNHEKHELQSQNNRKLSNRTQIIEKIKKHLKERLNNKSRCSRCLAKQKAKSNKTQKMQRPMQRENHGYNRQQLHRRNNQQNMQCPMQRKNHGYNQENMQRPMQRKNHGYNRQQLHRRNNQQNMQRPVRHEQQNKQHNSEGKKYKHQKSPRLTKEIFKKLDRNNDGVISIDEI